MEEIQKMQELNTYLTTALAEYKKEVLIMQKPIKIIEYY